VGAVLVVAALGWGVWGYVQGAPIRATAVAQPAVVPAGEVLTVLAWSDQHVTRDGDIGDLDVAVARMNGMAGMAWPAEVGGTVDRPALVLGTGDCTDWPTRASLAAYARLTQALVYPSYNLPGNHDEGAGAEDSAVSGWIRARHGGMSYTFDAGPVRFICLFSVYNPKHQITTEALAYLREQLGRVPAGMPVVVATHYGVNAIANKDALIDAMGPANVVLVVGGHLHQCVAEEYRGRQFLQLPSPRQTGQFVVLRIAPDRLTARTYDYRRGGWSDLERTKIDRRLGE
jgi:hypothetical protein